MVGYYRSSLKFIVYERALNMASTAADFLSLHAERKKQLGQ